MKTLILVSILSMSLAAQEDLTPKYPTKDQLGLEYFTPEHSNLNVLANVARELFGEHIPMVTDAGDIQWVSHFMTLGDMIVVQDKAKRLKHITETLRQMDQAQSGAPDAPALERMEYRPRHTSVSSLGKAMDSIHSLRRVLITEKRMLILEGPAAGITAARALIEKLDVPVAQVTITCHLIRGSDDANSKSKLPRELTENLARILPMTGFELLSVNAVQTSVSNHGIDLSSKIKGGFSYTVRLIPSAYDEQTKRLSLADCFFELALEGVRQHQLQTSLTLGQGEYVVLGAFGEDPIFVVLRMVPN